MTIKEKLIEEFGAAIIAVLGDQADREYNPDQLEPVDIEDIARKVKFYLGLR